MRTANVTGPISRNAGGLFESVRRLVQSLDAREVDVQVFGLSDQFSQEDIAAWNPVVVEAFEAKWPKPFGYSQDFLRALRRYAPDLTHTHGIWLFSSVATNTYSRSQRIPYVISAHGMLDPWALRNSKWKKVIAYLLYEGAHLQEARCIRALCQSEAVSIRKAGLKNPIAIIPNGIDLPEEVEGDGLRVESGTEQKPCLAKLAMDQIHASGRKVLFFLSRIHPKKGLPNLLRAWAKVRGERCTKDWVLAIAGWDQLGHEAELKRLCTDLSTPWTSLPPAGSPAEDCMLHAANSSVLFLGPQFGEAKALCYKNCDAFILPSYSEGVPMVVLEAWAYGKPVLMTPECNIPEAFDCGAALKIETNAERIATGLRQLFSSSDADQASLGTNGLALVKRRYVWSKLAEETDLLYRWMLGGGAVPPSMTDF